MALELAAVLNEQEIPSLKIENVEMKAMLQEMRQKKKLTNHIQI